MTSKWNCKTLTIILTLALGVTISQAGLARKNESGQGLNPLSAEEIADLKFMREEEKLARDSYLVLGEEWDQVIYSNIAESEQQHMDAVKRLLNNYGIADPVENEDVPGGFADPELQELYEFLLEWGEQSMMDGLLVGAAIEETDMEDIQQAINRASHDDIIATYESLICGSRNHLRGFVGQVESNGEVYQPIILTQEELDAVVNSPVERDCAVTSKNARPF